MNVIFAIFASAYVVVSACVLTMSSALAETPLLVIDNSGWITEADSLSFKTVSMWGKLEDKNRGAYKTLGYIGFMCDRRGEYTFIFSYNSGVIDKQDFPSGKPIAKIDKVRMTIDTVEYDFNMALGFYPNSEIVGVLGEKNLTFSPKSFIALIGSFYDSRAVNIKIPNDPTFDITLNLNMFDEKNMPSAGRPKEALSTAYTVCQSYLKR